MNLGFDPAWCARLTLTLGHFLWQGLAVAALCAGANFALRRASANARYLVWLGGLGVMALCLPVTAILIPTTDSDASPTVAMRADKAMTAVPEVSLPVAPRERATASGLGDRITTTAPTQLETNVVQKATAAAPEPVSGLTWHEALRQHGRVASLYVAGIYLAGVFAMLARLLLALRGAERLRRDALPLTDRVLRAVLAEQVRRLGLRAAPLVAICGRVAVPVVVGVLRPMVLLPVCMTTGLTGEPLRAALLHELAHIRRYDHWANLFQRLVEAFLFFHPAIWYVSRQASGTREHCCDDLAVSAGMGRLEYAAALVHMAEVCCNALERPAATALAATGDRPAALRRRVMRLIDAAREPEVRLTRGGQVTLVVAALVMIGGPVWLQWCWAAPSDVGAQVEAAAQPSNAPRGVSPPGPSEYEPRGAAPVPVPSGPLPPVAPAEVRAKIEALATPDETLPPEQQAMNWLRDRRDQIVPQLIAGLDDPNQAVAEGCLRLLHGAAASKELTDALVAKAGDDESPLRYLALRQLERAAADPRVVRLLDEASTQAKAFPDAIVRARWAWLAGKNDRAVATLETFLGEVETLSYEHVEAVRLLGQIGTPAAVETLEPIAAGDDWGMAVEAYRALAKIDPAKHGLTKDQEKLLSEWRGFKESTEQFQKRMHELARLDRKELRPLVMQMLRDKGFGGQQAALLILAAWQDKEALPQIGAIMKNERSYARQQSVAAYLTIEADAAAQEAVLSLLEEHDEFGNERVLAGIVTAEMPTKKQVAMLQGARATLRSPRAVPAVLRYHSRQGRDIQVLLAELMGEETDLTALSGYCELAARDKDKRFAPQVRRAVKRLVSEPAISSEQTPTEIVEAARGILDAAAAYDLKDAAPDVRRLMGAMNVGVRTTAQATGAKLGIAEARRDLYAQLADAAARPRATLALLGLPPADEADRTAREEAVLATLGKPGEEWTMRALTTCGGAEAVKALEPMLEDGDVDRAVYAAWVLAQLPDQAAAAKGLRRVAIYAMFHHQVYQQGAGIDFSIAPELNFHQDTQRLNRDPRAYATGEGPVRISEELLVPFAWDAVEQQFAVRCYQKVDAGGSPYMSSVQHWLGPHGTRLNDPSHVPLLKEIAARDSHVERVMVKGQAVAHFKLRQQAAQAIAAITQEKANYGGLAGETLDSEAFPAGYPEQNKLLAKLFVDRVEQAGLTDKPASDRDWQHSEFYRRKILWLRDQFGLPVLDAIRDEATKRTVSMENILPPKEG